MRWLFYRLSPRWGDCFTGCPPGEEPHLQALLQVRRLTGSSPGEETVLQALPRRLDCSVDGKIQASECSGVTKESVHAGQHLSSPLLLVCATLAERGNTGWEAKYWLRGKTKWAAKALMTSLAEWDLYDKIALFMASLLYVTHGCLFLFPFTGESTRVNQFNHQFSWKNKSTNVKIGVTQHGQ